MDITTITKYAYTNNKKKITNNIINQPSLDLNEFGKGPLSSSCIPIHS